ncbi:sugar kinase [Faunimonas sp. B44]|uniref:sugar kinase n=1 Tax=Faunimonas sp. B44 TaxID=3461493 RepID=UPI00404445F8
MRPATFAAIGECMIELSGGAGDLWRMGFAGDTFNTAWYVRQLLPSAEPVAYVTALGTDPFSRRMTGFFAESGIAADRIRAIPERRPGLYAITLEGAERSFSYWRAESAARLLAADTDWLGRALSGARMLHFSAVTLAILDPDGRARLLASVAAARAAGAIVSFDTNYRPPLWAGRAEAAAAIRGACATADVVLPTFDDERDLFGDAWPEASAERIATLGAREVVVKHGAAPAVVLTPAGIAHVPPVAGVAPVDTTGAGDSFGGGYLAARLLGHPPIEAVHVGHRVAASVVGVHGALTHLAPGMLAPAQAPMVDP